LLWIAVVRIDWALPENINWQELCHFPWTSMSRLKFFLCMKMGGFRREIRKRWFPDGVGEELPAEEFLPIRRRL